MRTTFTGGCVAGRRVGFPLVQEKVVVASNVDMATLLGQHDENLRLLQDRFDLSVVVRGNEISIAGESEADVATVVAIVGDLVSLASGDEPLTTQIVERTIDSRVAGDAGPAAFQSDIILTHRGKVIRPKTDGQKRYVEAIRRNTITFGIGPAGTGKTYLAMAMAVDAFRRKQVARIILTRPAVEAGESLGFLPGTLTEKVDPYMRPLYDALFDMMDTDKSAGLLEHGTIEISPLAFMRGRTLNDSFIILDEAQNTTPAQMKMFLTRLGFNSKVVITGDRTQVDLPRGTSGMQEVDKILGAVSDIGFVELGGKDVVRHRLVQRIVNAYQEYEAGGHQLTLPEV